MKIWIGIVVILILIIFIYARYIEPYKLKVKQIIEGSTNGIRILQISDIHYGHNFDRRQLINLVELINSHNYDILVFTGDFFDDRYSGDLDDIMTILSKINNKTNMYAIWGNHDYKSYAYSVYEKLMQESGFKLLRNSSDILNIRQRTLRIVGSDDYLKGRFSKSYLESFDLAYDNILLLHEPDAVDHFNFSNFKYILSGHSHGGQVVLPLGIRGRNKMGSRYQEGLFVLSATTKLYVSGGLGTTGMRLRLNMPPSLSILVI